MNTLWKRFQANRSYKRVQKLWEEYLQVASAGDEADVSSKLGDFLDTFQSAYHEWVAANPDVKPSLDKISGDCSEILLALLDLLDRVGSGVLRKGDSQQHARLVSDVTNKTMAVVELILRDEKYHRLIQETPDTVTRILALLDTFTTPEGKRNVLGLIRQLGYTDQNRLEIGKKGGFKKILDLMLDEDEDLTQEIVSTLKRFLDGTDTSKGGKQSEAGSKNKIGGLVQNIGSLFVSELQRVFPRLKDGEERNMRHVQRLSSAQPPRPFPPTRESINEAFDSLANLEFERNSRKESKECGNVFDSDNVTEDDMLKELMRVQGVLRALTRTISQAAVEVQLDLIETISRLLSNNERNQHEFREIDGYSIFLQLFENVADFSTPKSTMFLRDCLSIFFAIVVDGNDSALVGNMDALGFLFHLALSNAQTPARVESLKLLTDVASINPLNVVYFHRVGGVELLMQYVVGKSRESLGADESTIFSAIIDLLNYVAVIFSRHNSDQLSAYVDLLTSLDLRENGDKEQSGVIVKSVAALIRDMNARKIQSAQPESLMTCFIDKLSECISVDGGGEVSMFTLDMDTDAESGSESIDVDEGRNCVRTNLLIAILECIGHVVTGRSQVVSVFAGHNGFEIFMKLLSPVMPTKVFDMTLWLLQEFSFLSEWVDVSQWFLSLIEEETLPLTYRLKVFDAISQVMNMAGPESPVKKNFAHKLVLPVLRIAEGPHPDIALSAFQAFGDIIAGSDEAKLLVGFEVGFVQLSNALKACSLPHNKLFFDHMLELAMTGSFRNDLFASAPLPGPRIPSSSIFPVINGIRSPMPLVAEPLQCMHAISTSASTNDLQSLASQRVTTLQQKTSSASFIPSLNPQPSTTQSSPVPHFQDTTGDAETEASSVSSFDRMSEDKFQHSLMTFSSTAPTPRKRGGSSSSLSHDTFYEIGDRTTLPVLTGLSFHSPEAALMIINLLPIAVADVQREVIRTLLALLEANPCNKRAFCQMHGLSIVLALSDSYNEEIQSYYLQLAASIGMYHITANEVRLLFQLASIKPKSERQKEQQMQALYLIGLMAERTQPTSYLSFTGGEGYVSMPSVDRLPSGRVGYTFWCWVRPKIFNGMETTLLTFEDASDVRVFECFFAKLHADEKRYICIRWHGSNQRHPQTLPFEDCGFTEQGRWRLIVFSHSKHGFTLYVDGEAVGHVGQVAYPPSMAKVTGYLSAHRTQEDWTVESSSASQPLEVPPNNGGCQSSCSANSTPRSRGNSLAGVSHIKSLQNRRFCGEMGSVHFCEGTVPAKAAQRLFQRGPFESDNATLSESNKQLFQVDARNYIDDNDVRNRRTSYVIGSSPSSHNPAQMTGMGSVGSGGSGSVVSSDSAFEVSPSTVTPNAAGGDVVRVVVEAKKHSATHSSPQPLSTSSNHAPGPLPSKGSPQVVGQVTAHATFSIKESIGQAGGLGLCFPFLSMGTEYLIASLRVLSGLMQNSSDNRHSFKSIGGYDALLYVLKEMPAENLTCEIFDLLFDVMCDGVSRRKRVLLHDTQVLTLVVTLIPSVKESVQNHVLKSLADALSKDDNLSFFLENAGLASLFRLYGDVDQSVVPRITAIVARIIPHAKADHIEEILEFLTVATMKEGKGDTCRNSCGRDMTEICCDILGLLHDQLIRCAASVEAWWQSFEAGVMLNLLAVGPPRVTVPLFKIIGVFLHAVPKYKAHITRCFAFEGMKSVFRQRGDAPTSELCSAILEVATSAPSMTTTNSKTPPSNRDKTQKLAPDPKRLLHPEVIFVLLDAFSYSKTEASDTTALRFLADLEVLWNGSSDNLDILIDKDFLEACCGIIRSRAPQAKTVEELETFISHNPLCAQVCDIVTQLIIYEMSRPSKSCRLAKFKDLVDAELTQVVVFRNALNKFEANPSLLGTLATTSVPNLMLLLEILEETQQATLETLVRVIDMINIMAVESSSPVRTKMKDVGLFEFRDNLVIACLRSAYHAQSKEQTEIIKGFSFDSIAQQPKHRESAVLYLLRLFHKLDFDKDLQQHAALLLREHLGCFDECRRVVMRCLEDPETISRLFGSDSAPGRSSPTNEDSSKYDSRAVLLEVLHFVNWYTSEEASASRHGVVRRVDKLLQPFESTFRKQEEKIQSKKSKRVRQVKERHAKASTQCMKVLGDIDEKRSQRLKQSESSRASCESAWATVVQDRLERGKSSWRELLDIHDTLVPPELVERKRLSSGSGTTKRPKVTVKDNNIVEKSSAITISVGSLEGHEKGEGEIECPYCCSAFSDERQYTYHLNLDHLGTPPGTNN